MKKSFISIVVTMCCISAHSQNEYEIKKSIENSLMNFFSLLSFINDDEEPTNPSTIASDFRGEHYFRLNGTETTLENFLSSYSRSDLRNNFVNHTLQVSTNNIKKTSNTASDRRWNVKAKLLRENASGEDYFIKDEDVTFTVRWNGFDKEVSILDLNFSTPLKIVRPVTNREYKFEIDRRNSTLSVPYTGGDWKIAIQSWYRDVKSYPGIDGKTTVGDYYLSPYTYQSQNNLKITENKNPQYLSGNLRGNYSKQPRNYTINLTQTNTGKTLNETITVGIKSTHSVFDFDSDGYHQIELLYSLKYNFGLSYMYTFEDSRFSIGLLAAMNFDKFRGMKNFGGLLVSSYASVTIDPTGETGDGTTNGYKVTTETINPDKTNYSELLDPENEAKHYTSRSLYLAQAGFNISQWMRFDVGLGAARARNLYFMNNAYALDIYRYEKTSDNLPDIDDTYVYRNKYKDYYYKDPAKWGFAVRPALNFQIPLDSYDESYLTLGTGYTFVSGIKDASSLDFSIGIRWEY